MTQLVKGNSPSVQDNNARFIGLQTRDRVTGNHNIATEGAESWRAVALFCAAAAAVVALLAVLL